MKVLLLGSGGREHALAWKMVQSSKLEKLYVAPGNAGTAEIAENVNIAVTDFEALAHFIVEKQIEMLVMGELYYVFLATSTAKFAVNLHGKRAASSA